MKPYLFLTVLLLMLALSLPGRAFGQDHLSKEGTTTVYEGHIAHKYKIRMVLTERSIMRTRHGETFAVGTQYRGYYVYMNRGKRIPVRGDYDAMGVGGAEEFPVITLYETVNGKDTGRFEGRFGDTDFYSGTWHSADDKHKYPFALNPKPTVKRPARHKKTRMTTR